MCRNLKNEENHQPGGSVGNFNPVNDVLRHETEACEYVSPGKLAHRWLFDLLFLWIIFQLYQIFMLVGLKLAWRWLNRVYFLYFSHHMEWASSDINFVLIFMTTLYKCVIISFVMAQWFHFPVSKYACGCHQFNLTQHQ